MCGRYSLSTPLDELVETFDVSEVVLGEYRPRYNISPGEAAPVLVPGPQGLRLGLLRWGLVPFWADDPRVGSRMINARGETAHVRPAFREAFRRRRCLVPADGFYEWTAAEDPEPSAGIRRGRPRKIPYWVHRPDRGLLSFAGLWERWRPPRGGEPLHTFTILTTPANERLRGLHERMPVVLPPSVRDRWLDPGADPGALESMLRPAPDDMLDAWAVSTAVGSSGFDDPSCIVPVSEDRPFGGR